MRHDRRVRPRIGGKQAGAEPDPPEVAALREQGGAEAVARLTELASAEDRAVSKAARRALHALGAPAPMVGISLGDDSPEPQREAWVSGYSFCLKGHVLMTIESRYGGGFAIAACEVSSETGLVDSFSGTMSRSKLNAHLASMHAPETGHMLLQVPPEAARWTVNDALSRSDRRATAQFRSERIAAVVGEGGTEEIDARFAALASADVGVELAVPSTEPRDLCKHPPFALWFVEDGSIRPWLPRLAEALDSPVLLEEWQVRDRMRRIVDEAADVVFPASKLRAMRHAALVNALLLQVAGRPELAAMARYHALAYREDRPAHEWPLARHVVDRTIAGALSGPEDEDDIEDDDEGPNPSPIIRV